MNSLKHKNVKYSCDIGILHEKQVHIAHPLFLFSYMIYNL